MDTFVFEGQGAGSARRSELPDLPSLAFSALARREIPPRELSPEQRDLPIVTATTASPEAQVGQVRHFADRHRPQQQSRQAKRARARCPSAAVAPGRRDAATKIGTILAAPSPIRLEADQRRRGRGAAVASAMPAKPSQALPVSVRASRKAAAQQVAAKAPAGHAARERGVVEAIQPSRRFRHIAHIDRRPDRHIAPSPTSRGTPSAQAARARERSARW